MTRLPAGEADILLVRPLLDVPKARLIATLRRAGIAFADDPTNRDPRFTRARLRAAMPALAREGSDPGAPRPAGAPDAAGGVTVLEAAVAEAWAALAPGGHGRSGSSDPVRGARRLFPAEVALRLLGRAIDRVGRRGAGRAWQARSDGAALHGPLIAYTRHRLPPPFSPNAGRGAGDACAARSDGRARAGAPGRRLETALTKRKGGGASWPGPGLGRVTMPRILGASGSLVPLAGGTRGPTLTS